MDLVALVVERGEARGVPDRAVDVDHAAAESTDQMMMVVADAIFETRWRSCRLKAAEEPSVDQHGERVVDRLKRDGADLGSDHLRDRVRRDVRMTADGAEDSQPLGCDLNTALTKEVGRV